MAASPFPVNFSQPYSQSKSWIDHPDERTDSVLGALPSRGKARAPVGGDRGPRLSGGQASGGRPWRAITSLYQWALDFGVRSWVS
ncbi:hypothetical protein GCM10010298_02240 [Streptomyces microflavus]|nr:hypothetical protein GCM10010298_02240 [Streptomyces microflavus]